MNQSNRIKNLIGIHWINTKRIKYIESSHSGPKAMDRLQKLRVWAQRAKGFPQIWIEKSEERRTEANFIAFREQPENRD